MKNSILTFLLILFVSYSYSQKTNDSIVYNFINNIGLTEVNNKKVKVYLCQELFPTIVYIDFYKREIYDSLSPFFTKEELDNIIIEEKSAYQHFLWDKKKISFAGVLSESERDTLEKLNDDSLVLYLSLTYPRFSKNKKYLIQLINKYGKKSDGSLGSTCIYLYHLINEKWEIYKTIECDMS